MSILWCHR